ncbi:MAG: hypothetical protein Q4C12_01645 [Clostridia bacterium]|nr:hypothetical protein [Clostridia bacterium]
MAKRIEACREEQSNEIKYDLIEVVEQKALFTNARLTDEDVSDGLYCYHLRYSDSENGFISIEPRVGVNHGGSVITKFPIDFGDDGYISFDDDTSPNFLGEHMTIWEYVQTDFEQEQTGGINQC